MTPEARAARERKQKIFVIVGGLFLLALLAIQLPKLLGGSASPEAATTTTTAAQVPGQPVQAGAAPVALAVPVETGKLTSLSAFEAKDPFVQQVATQNGAGAPAEGGAVAKGTGSAGSKAEKPKPTRFSTGRPTGAAATIVTVNGQRQVLEPGMKFPASDPLFVLVAEKPGSKAVVVGIAGGAYAGGHQTTTLKLGRPLTLVNTATGARYKISLVSVGSADAAEQAAPSP